MGLCEICGSDDKLVNAVVEGCMLSVCSKCAKHGSVVVIDKVEDSAGALQKNDRLADEDDSVFVSDCALEVKNAREKKNLTQEQLAKAIAEKEATIHRIESGKFKPDINVAKKLEQFLGIKIIHDSDKNFKLTNKELNFRDETLTIGDLINMKKSLNK